jgi:hypothetical protein
MLATAGGAFTTYARALRPRTGVATSGPHLRAVVIVTQDHDRVHLFGVRTRVPVIALQVVPIGAGGDTRSPSTTWQ